VEEEKEEEEEEGGGGWMSPSLTHILVSSLTARACRNFNAAGRCDFQRNQLCSSETMKVKDL
jgi:hypothetical protein